MEQTRIPANFAGHDANGIAFRVISSAIRRRRVDGVAGDPDGISVPCHRKTVCEPRSIEQLATFVQCDSNDGRVFASGICDAVVDRKTIK